MAKHKNSDSKKKNEGFQKEYKGLIILEGHVIEAHANAIFSVELDNKMVVKLPVSGKIRQHNITISLGDRVQIGLSEYDLTNGRILYRYKKEKNDDNSTVQAGS